MKSDNEFFEVMDEISTRRELGELHTPESDVLIDRAWEIAPDSILTAWLNRAVELGMIQTPLAHPAHQSAEELL